MAAHLIACCLAVVCAADATSTLTPGALAWKFKTNGWVASSPAVHPTTGVVYVYLRLPSLSVTSLTPCSVCDEACAEAWS